MPLLCLSGNPATVGVAVLDALVAAGAQVRYHGDFDVEGVRIAARVVARGVLPWRMSAQDYLQALALIEASDQLPLSGQVAATSWDPALAGEMNRAGIGVHEEALLKLLLEDLVGATAASTE